MLDLQGKVLKEGSIENNQTTINTSKFAKGLYFIELSNKNATLIRKIQIVH